MLVLKLWYLVLIVLALHAAWLGLKKLRARRIASSRKVTSTPADQPSTSAISWMKFAHVRDLGTSPTATATSQLSSSRTEPGLTPRHIPEQRTRLIRTTWEPTLPGWYSTSPTLGQPQAGRPAGGEEPSLSEGWWDNGYRQIYGEHEGPWHWHSGHRHEGGERWHQHGEASSVPEYSHSNLRQQPPSG